jgi:hypothetical protein
MDKWTNGQKMDDMDDMDDMDKKWTFGLVNKASTNECQRDGQHGRS